MTHESSIDKINAEVDYYIQRHNLDKFSIDTRIQIFQQLKDKVETEETNYQDAFQMTQLLQSEINVLKVRKHLRQLPLF